MGAQQEHDAHLVTGNSKDFPVKPFVVTPAEMRQIIDGKRKKIRLSEQTGTQTVYIK